MRVGGIEGEHRTSVCHWRDGRAPGMWRSRDRDGSRGPNRAVIVSLSRDRDIAITESQNGPANIERNGRCVHPARRVTPGTPPRIPPSWWGSW
jgi:hypothetical protein